MISSGCHVDEQLCCRVSVERKAAGCGCVRGGCPGPLPCRGDGGGRRGLVSDTVGRIDRTQSWIVIKIRAKSYSQILGLATRQEEALFAQLEKAEERGIQEIRTDDPRDREGEAGKVKTGEGRGPGIWRGSRFGSVGSAVSDAAESLWQGTTEGRSCVCPGGC